MSASRSAEIHYIRMICLTKGYFVRVLINAVENYIICNYQLIEK